MTNQANSGSRRIFLTGGTGFIGSVIRRQFAGRPLRMLVRSSTDSAVLREEGIEVVTGDVTDANSLRGVMQGVDTVVHLVAIIRESGSHTFDDVIRQGTEHVVAEARSSGVRRFVLMSALGAEDNTAFPYLKAKWDAEQAVRHSGIPWTFMRPSVVFGPGDEFVNTLADLVRRAPVIPIVGAGRTRFQPVYVGDVAESFARVIDDDSTSSAVFELGGPDMFTYEEMIDSIMSALQVNKRKVHIPVGLMSAIVTLSSPLPSSIRPPVTKEQLKMLALDNCTDHSATVELIGHTPMTFADGIAYISRDGGPTA